VVSISLRIFQDELNSMDRGGFSTQLADTKPQFDVALRVAIPVNAPARAQRPLRNSLIRINAFSPSAYAASRQFLSSARSADKNDGHDIHTSADLSVLFNLDNDSNIKTLVKDFTMVAASSRRAGKMDTEASAYVSLGVICDNQGKLGEAIEFYLKYLRICTEIDDEAGCACACNCLGVNYMLMASPLTDVGILHGVKTNHQGQENLSFAIKYHTQHLQIGPDSGGHFVAHSNLGLCYGMAGTDTLIRDVVDSPKLSLNNRNMSSGEVVVSAQHHQNALRIAIKMQTMYGQAIAVGNLGALALKKEDIGTSRTCFEQVSHHTLNYN
jgi:tetratricopeptide (TPR) repeat protein